MRLLTIAVLTLFCLYNNYLEASEYHPDPYSVQRWEQGYRYPNAGWIVVHIEGEPYERGIQHGRLLAPEIARYTQALASFTDPKSPVKAWKTTRNLVKRFFLHGFNQEQLDEMKGIADGASAAGARFNRRPLDIIDIAALNLANELHTFDTAITATPSTLTTQHHLSTQFTALNSSSRKAFQGPVRCNAFAAVGPATKDGKIVFGHLTMFALYPANFYNVWLDIKPSKGHRFVMQTTPGNIQSGMDYSINDAGILMSETTVEQTGFNPKGIPLAARTREAEQYAETIEQAADILRKNNNGLSSTEWILADIHKNEIALLELGTHRSKLYRSSQKEWIAGAEGFYWSNNNTKDRDIRLETVPSAIARPSSIAAFRTDPRDAIWLRMYDQHKGQIDGEFAKKLLTTPEIVLSTSVDAKYTTSDLATRLQTWATYGPPLGVVRYPSTKEQQDFPAIKPLISNPWQILNSEPPAKNNPHKLAAVDLHNPNNSVMSSPVKNKVVSDTQPAWRGTLLPQSDADIWLTTAFANLERIVAYEKALQKQNKNQQLKPADRDLIINKLFYYRSMYELAARAGNDFPLNSTKINLRNAKWYDIVTGKGVLLLYALRSQLGNDEFDVLMDKFGTKNSLHEISATQFQNFLQSQTRKDLSEFFNLWLNNTDIPQIKMTNTDTENVLTAPPYTIFSFDAEIENTIIVFGTKDEELANREAANVLQQALKRRKHNIAPPIKADTELSENDIKSNHLILIGRPDSNLLINKLKNNFPINFGLRSFQARDKIYAHPESGIIFSFENPDNARFSIVVVSGLSALTTLNITQPFGEGTLPNARAVIIPFNREILGLSNYLNKL
ncbi:C45 family autoproteolytic acyltransferase/hydolase [uncultured Tolumonas sp.]|uniref:C45 family autoproteolytic acyltransferase/hydolase n=1 Tax=uncultured Tolumonas sp. TaxID=263765 RepID=UPI00292EE908|nr:C45 family autoproteolytic acyltransferase/hydolase [uncultured Tolumonas sp.]